MESGGGLTTCCELDCKDRLSSPEKRGRCLRDPLKNFAPIGQ
jgi:hypothetical protein